MRRRPRRRGRRERAHCTRSARYAASAPAAERDARGDRRAVPRRAEEPQEHGAVLLAAPLERTRIRHDDLRPRRARALPARGACETRRRATRREQAAASRFRDDRRPRQRSTPTTDRPATCSRSGSSCSPSGCGRRARDGRVLPGARRRAEGALGRPARDGRADRRGRGHPTSAHPLDGRELPRRSDASLRQLVLDEQSVIGRISPEGKRRVVEALARAAATSRWSATA